MRIKSDFVTNSSSTSYIVSIPRKLVLNIDFNKFYGDGDYTEEECDIKNVLKTVEALKDGNTVCREDMNYEEFDICLDILSEKELILYRIDTHDDTTISGIPEEKLYEFYKNFENMRSKI